MFFDEVNNLDAGKIRQQKCFAAMYSIFQPNDSSILNSYDHKPYYKADQHQYKYSRSIRTKTEHI